MKTWFLYGVVIAVGLVVIDDQAWAMGKKSRSSSLRRTHSSADAQDLTYATEAELEQEMFFLTTQSTGHGFEEQRIFSDLASLEKNGIQENFAVSANNYQVNPESEAKVYTSDNSQWNQDDVNFPSATTVPEPATMTLMGLGMAAMMLKKKR